jgi:DNA adenine methylase
LSIAETPERPALRYHGGKWLLAPWIIEHMPPHRVYVEPFGGAASVLMRKPRSYAEVYNDRWETVVNVFRVLRDPVQACNLKRALELTPFSRDEFFGAHHEEADDPVERARKTIFRSFAGFGSAATNGEYPTGFRANSNRSGTTPAQDWLNYPAEIPAFVNRMRGVVIENRDALDVIAQQDGDETLFFLDPPYVHSTRNMQRGNAAYAVEMTDADHERLAEAARNAVGMVMLSGYHSALYDRLYAEWTRIERAALADGAVDRIEVLWLNAKASARLEASRSQLGLFPPQQRADASELSRDHLKDGVSDTAAKPEE